jgi:anthranilate phosphoribosyltransferase
MSVTPDTIASVVGGYRAIVRRVQHLHLSDTRYRPLVFSTDNDTRLSPNLLPWLALVLRRLGVPVLVHGSLGGAGAAASAYVFRELGVMPGATLARVQATLEQESLAFVPDAVLCPGLANLFALRKRLGLQNVANKLAALLDPFSGDGVRIVGVKDACLREIFETVCCDEALDALVFDGADDDAFVDPYCRPRIVTISDGKRAVLFDSEPGSMTGRMILPEPFDVAGTARWITAALAGEVPVPHSLVNQLACCLFVSRYAADMCQAKAIAAMQSGALVAGSASVGAATGVASDPHPF